MNKLTDMLKIISEDGQHYYLKTPEEVDKKVLMTIDLSFAILSTDGQEFADQWFKSKSFGTDAIQPSEQLEDRLDVKLLEKGKLDFKQMKKIMIRMNRVDDALMGLNRIKFYMNHLENLCNEKGLPRIADHAKLFKESMIEQAIETIETEGKRLRNQIDRCNLYFQPAIKTKSLNIAYIALIISSLSFLLAILNSLKLI